VKASAIILIIVCAAVLCYANSFSVPFLWDDEVLVLRNHYIRSFEFLGSIFSSSHFQGGGEAGSFYRPIQTISYLFDYSLWKLNPFGYHLTNLILHCAVAIAVYFLISKISADNLIGFLSALFFVVHPVHTEAVTYIAGRADLLACAFLLFSFLYFLKLLTASGAKRYLYWIISCLFYILALLSKESALIFLVLIGIYGFCFLRQKEIKPWIPAYISFLLISAAYVLIRMRILPFGQSHSLSLIAQAPLFERLITIPKICLTYLGLLVFPLYLHMERHFLVTSIANPYFWPGLILLLLTIWFLKSAYRHNRKAFFYVSWFVIALIPVFNIVPLNATAAEHWLYLPAVGFWALAASTAVKFFREAKKYRKALLALACLLFLFYCPRTIMRNFQWRNPLGLYAHDVRHSPKSFLLHNNLGVELFRRGRLKEAGKEFEAAVKIAPRYATSRNNLGVVLENAGGIDQALTQYRASIDLNNYILAYENLGRLYLQLGRIEEAQAILEKGTRLYPQNTNINYYLSLTYK